MPKLCGAGVFAFAGYPAKTVKGMEGFFGLIAEYDSNAGFKVTGLYESSHGDPEADPFNPKTHEIGGVGGGTTATGRPRGCSEPAGTQQPPDGNPNEIAPVHPAGR